MGVMHTWHFKLFFSLEVCVNITDQTATSSVGHQVQAEEMGCRNTCYADGESCSCVVQPLSEMYIRGWSISNCFLGKNLGICSLVTD